tara:strand:+ start:411 stop:695 length:285 start_codon:yes stop_codon:yes gene_type:complete
MQKPIEPGCLAYVKSGPGAGITVTCLEHKAPGFQYKSANTGRRVETLVPAWIAEEPDSKLSIFSAHDLMRIDGGDPDATQEETQDQEVPTDALA